MMLFTVPIQSYMQDYRQMSHSRKPVHGVSGVLHNKSLLHVSDLHLVQPWGRMVPIRTDLEKGSKSEAEGGTGIGEKFWAWSEEQVKSYL